MTLGPNMDHKAGHQERDQFPIDKTFKTKTQVSDPGSLGHHFIMALLDMIS